MAPYPVDVLLAQAVLVAVLLEGLGGVDHEDGLPGSSALPGGWDAVGPEAAPRIVLGIEASAPALVEEGRIGDDVVEGLQRVPSKNSELTLVFPGQISAMA
jgi:hypothetical protein